MKNLVIVSVALILLFPAISFPQEESAKPKPDYIRGGFYIKAGPSFSVGKFADTQETISNNDTLSYLPGKIGPAMDLGFLVYIGPAFANNRLRAGIDATFLSVWFNSTNPVDNDNRYDHYYYFGGQKFGPVITYNPIDRLMIDFSYKLNANFGYHYDEWDQYFDDEYNKYGTNLTYQEVSLSVRYRVILFSLQYNFGEMNYDNFDKERNDLKISTNTIRILIGFKF